MLDLHNFSKDKIRYLWSYLEDFFTNTNNNIMIINITNNNNNDGFF